MLRDVAGDQALTQYKTAHVSRGAQLGLVIKYSQRLSQPVVDRLKKRFEAMYSGPENAGRTLVLDEGADVTVVGARWNSCSTRRCRRPGERRICAAAGPGMLVILGFEAGDYQTAIRKLADLWARPSWRMACASLEHLLPVGAVRGAPVVRRGGHRGAARGGAGAVAGHPGADAGRVLGGRRRVHPGKRGRRVRVGGPVAAGAGSGRAARGDLRAGDGDQSDRINGRPPQAGLPQDLPGVVQPNLPNAKPFTAPPMPSLPNGARG